MRISKHNNTQDSTVEFEGAVKRYSTPASLHDSMNTVENTSVAVPETSHHDDTTTAAFEEFHPLMSSEGSKTSSNTASADLDGSSNGTNNSSGSSGSSSGKRGRRSMRKKDSQRLNLEELLEASKRHRAPEGPPKPIWESQFAKRLYIVIAISICLRTWWILQCVSVMILLRIARLLVSWFLYVASAKEIREFKGLAKWWFNFGLKFSTKTIEGDRFHSILTSFTLNFWSKIGINYSLNLYKDIAMQQRHNVVLQAKENLNRAKNSSLNMKNVIHGSRRG